MKLKILSLMMMGFMGTTVFANELITRTQPKTVDAFTVHTQTEMLDLKPVAYSASEPFPPVNLIPIQQINGQAQNTISNKEQQQNNQQVILNSDYDYLHSYDVPVHTQADYERAKKFVESERERQNSGYPIYMPMYYR